MSGDTMLCKHRYFNSWSKLTITSLLFVLTYLCIVKFLQESDSLWGSLRPPPGGSGEDASTAKFRKKNRTLITEIPPELRSKLISAGYRVLSKKMSFSTVLEVKSKWPELPYYELTLREFLTDFPQQSDEFWVGLLSSIGPLMVGEGPVRPESVLFILKYPNVTQEFEHCLLDKLGSKINSVFQLEHKSIPPQILTSGENLQRTLENFNGNLLIINKCSFNPDCSPPGAKLTKFLDKYLISPPIDENAPKLLKRLLKTMFIFMIDLNDTKEIQCLFKDEDRNVLDNCENRDNVLNIIKGALGGGKNEDFYEKLIASDASNLILLKNEEC